MNIDPQREVQIKGVFQLMAQYKNDAKEANTSATEALTNLVESMSADKNERKLIKKALTKAFREYQEECRGEPDTLGDALQIIQFTCKGVDA